MAPRLTPQLYAGDIGTRFVIRVFQKDADGVPQPMDLSGTDTRTIRLRDPDGVSVDKTMGDVDLPNGVVDYVTVDGDIPAGKHGLWFHQVLIVTGTTRDQATESRAFLVGERLVAP